MDEIEFLIERVLTGLSPDTSVDRALYGYRSQDIHLQALKILPSLADLHLDVEVDIQSPRDLVITLQSIVTVLLQRISVTSDSHLRSHLVRSVDILSSAATDLLNHLDTDTPVIAEYCRILQHMAG